ncbi:MAG: hypothetical protein MI892_23475 [Desulfobacterales bacterium]|nr:hypothetical protein [Desulfobacterales bacterium]
MVDSQGRVITHDLRAPEDLSAMVASCGNAFVSIGSKRFKYASFSRRNNKNVLIFPVGKFFLGVIKEDGVRDFEAAEAVIKLLNKLADMKRSNREAT